MSYFFKFLSKKSLYRQLKKCTEPTYINSSKPFAIQLELKQWHDNKKTFHYREAFEVSTDHQMMSAISWIQTLFCCWFHYLSSLGYYKSKWRSGPTFTESQKLLQNIFSPSYWRKQTFHRISVRCLRASMCQIAFKNLSFIASQISINKCLLNQCCDTH